MSVITKKSNPQQLITLLTIKGSFPSIKPKNKFKTIPMISMTMNSEIKKFMIICRLLVKLKLPSLLNFKNLHFVDGKIMSFMISAQKMIIGTSLCLENGVELLHSSLSAFEFFYFSSFNSSLPFR